MRTITAGVLALAASFMCSSTAAAQMKWTEKGYVAVTGGVQAGSDTLATDTEFTLYDEQGRVTSSSKVGGGGFFDVSGGYKVWQNLVIALGVSYTGSSNDIAVSASVPDPLRFDQLRSVSATVSGAKYSENAVHFSAVWMVPVTDKFDVGVSAGPTVFMVKQDVPSGLTASEPGPTVSLQVNEAKKTTAGFHAGVDLTYLIRPKLGVGVLARYTLGSVELAGTSESLTVGGFQFGAGLRIRF